MYNFLYGRLENLVYFGGQGIVLIRNPYKAILSAYQHLRNGVHSGSDVQLRNNILEALENRDKTIDKEDFEKFAIKQIISWRDIILDWVILGGKVLVVYFEDFVKNKTGQIEKVLDFLKIPKEKERMKCVKFATLDFYRRRNNYAKEHKISKYLKKKILKIVNEVDTILKIFGHSSLPLTYLNI